MPTDRDISFQKNTETTNRSATKSEGEWFHHAAIVTSLVEAAPIGIMIFDKQGNITFANQHAENALGLEKSTDRTQRYNSPVLNITDFIEEILPRDKRSIEPEKPAETPAENLQYTIKHLGGKQVLLTINAIPVYDKDQHFDGIVVVIQDITSQTKTDAEVNRLQNLNASIVQNISEGITLQDPEGMFSYVNPALAKMLDYQPDELIGKHWTVIIPQDQHEIVRHADKRRLRGRTDRYELELLKKNGGRVPVLVSANPWIDANTGEFLGSLAVFSDITEQNQAEEQLRQRADQLKLINDVGEQIAAVLDLDRVLLRTTRVIQESFKFEHVSLFMVERPSNQIVMKAVSGDFEQLFPTRYSLSVGEGLVGMAVQKKKTFLVNDTNNSTEYLNRFPDKIHTRSELCVPICIEEEVVGVLDAQSIHQNAFDKNDVMVMETLADQVAVAIHNANLHEAVHRELIERTRIETALRESEEKFRNIVQSSPMGMHIYELGPDGSLIFVGANPAADKILGVDNQQFIGKSIQDAFPNLMQTEVPEKYRLVAATGQPWSSQQINYDDNQISGVYEVYAFQTSPGRMVAKFQDITERKLAEEALRRSEDTLSSIFRAAPTGIGLVSDRVLLEVNQRICEMTGYTQEELVGKNARILYPSDDDYEYVGREKYRLIRKFGTGTVETRWQHKNGQIIDVLMSSTPIDPDNLSNGVTFTALDITDRKSAEIRLQSQLQRLAALNQIDAAITSNLSLDHTIDILLDQTVRQLNIDAAAILFYKPSTHSLEYFGFHGFTNKRALSGSTRLGQKYSGRVALERQTIKASIGDKDFLKNLKTFENEGFQSYCGIPLITKGQVKGVLEVFHRGLLAANEDWLNFIETLAGQAAIAIDNAEMVENLERSNLELRLAYNTTLEGWARALELRDFETRGHSQNVTELTIQLARAVGIPEETLVHVQRGALLHDIGKMGIPDQILLKNGPLDEDEWEIMRQHPVYAYEMLSEIEFLRPALDIPYYHHERWDGSGYPHGLKGESIPLAARVFTVVDVWDALSSVRPYRGAWSKEAVLNYIREGSGTYFDPRVVDAFMRIIDST